MIFGSKTKYGLQSKTRRPDISAPAKELVESLALIYNPIHFPQILFIKVTCTIEQYKLDLLPNLGHSEMLN